MHGREGEERRKRSDNRHMWPVPIRVASVVPDAPDGSSSSSASSSPNFFCKDGRNITVGDCALFKPPQESPPFIGVIRQLTIDKEENLTLGVNWLYRPADITLGKGILLEAAPNEIFYSFHRDETPAESLLHPCKVAFLPKGVELPSGISSYVCRRVYDIKTKRLWWLTDQDYLNEQQEEVDQLLDKTRIEMHATVQTGGRSPKPMNGPTSSSQLKPGSDSVQNSTSSFASQNKGKKRERGDQGSEPVKRERTSRIEDGDLGHCRSENLLKSEIAKITEKGGLTDADGVEKLVALMLPDRNDKKVDLASRTMLAGVIAATEKLDCLSRFVHLRGLPVLDEWLQEVHKGKVGDGSGLKENDKSVEEFLLVLLRALEKLPVNLQALQMCNIGKSVNHLRTHKNLEIQRKARSLVDIWKKGVEAEMNINDARSGSNQGVAWSVRSRLSEVSHAGSRHSGSISETAPKSSVSQISALKTASGKLVQGETAKPAAVSPGSMKSAPSPAAVNLKEGQSRSAVVSVSNYPLTASRDEKSTSSSQSHNNSQSCSSDQARTGGISGKEDARSSTAISNKISSGSTRHRKSANGVSGSTASGAHKEAGSGRTHSSHRNMAAEKASHPGLTCEKTVDAPAEGTGHKLIVKIPNRSRSPAQNASGGSFEDHSITNSRASSPAIAERPDRFDHALKEKGVRNNISSDVNTESWQSNDFKDVPTGSDEGDGSPAANPDECRSGENIKKLSAVAKAASSSPRNELNPEKLHEASLSSINALIDCAKYSEPLGDDVGMNLLASVAAGEIASSDWVSPSDSPPGNTSAVEHSSTGHDSLMKSSPQDGNLQDRHDEKEGTPGGKLESKKGDDKTNSVASEGKLTEEREKNINSGASELQQASELCHASKGCVVTLAVATVPASPVSEAEKITNVEGSKRSQENVVFGGIDMDNADAKTNSHASVIISNAKVEPESSELLSGNGEDKKVTGDPLTEKKSTVVVQPGETTEKNLGLEDADLKAEKGFQAEALSCSEITENKGECIKEKLECKAVCLEHVDAKSEVHSMAVNEAEECTSTDEEAASLSTVGKLDKTLKLKFDLNEGISADDGKCSDTVNLAASGSLMGSSSFPASVSTSLPASVTVAAAAKGPFVPPDDLLRNKVELGWKGSAATSAFSRLEPRKAVELSMGSANAPHPPDAIGKKSRPPLDFDLNVADDRVLDDLASRNSVQEAAPLVNTRDEMSSSAPTRSGGLDLDLNRVDDTSEIGSYSTMNGHRLDARHQPSKSLSGSLSNGAGLGLRRDFDLNDGPIVDDACAEPSTSGQHVRSSIHPQQPFSSLRMNNSAELGNLSTWFPPASTYSAVAVPSLLPEREQSFPIAAAGGPQRLLGPSGGGSPFGPDVFRGPVLSSPAVPFASSYQYSPVFSFGTNFPLPSVSFSGSSATYVDPSSGGRFCFPPVNSQLLGPAGAVSTQYPRPYVVNLSDSSNSGGLDRKWARQGLDLNAGPGGPDTDARDELTPIAARQLSVANSQAIAEEGARLYQVSSGILKRKEPEGGWDSYKQSSWQS